MQTLYVVLMILFGIFILFSSVKIFSSALKWPVKFVFNSVLGFAGLLLFNMLGSGAGFSLGLTWFNVVIVGILGVPGFGLLLLLQWLFALP